MRRLPRRLRQSTPNPFPPIHPVMAPTDRPVMTPRFRAAVLLAALVATTFGVLAESRAWALDSSGAEYRLVTYVVIGVTAGYQLLRQRRIEAVAALAALAFCALSLTEAWQTAGFDSGYTLACLILISLVYVATRESKSVVPLVLVSGLTATYTVASLILDRPAAGSEIAEQVCALEAQIIKLIV